MGFFDFISILHSNFFIYSKYDEVKEKSDIDDLCFQFDKPDGIPWLFFLFPFHLQLGQTPPQIEITNCDFKFAHSSSFN